MIKVKQKIKTHDTFKMLLNMDMFDSFEVCY